MMRVAALKQLALEEVSLVSSYFGGDVGIEPGGGRDIDTVEPESKPLRLLASEAHQIRFKRHHRTFTSSFRVNFKLKFELNCKLLHCFLSPCFLYGH